MRTIPLLAAACLLPLAALADACPWLGSDVAAQVILVKPTEVKLEKDPVPPNSKGLVASTTCRFKGKDEGIGQLSVIVMDFGNEATKQDPDGAVLSTHEVARQVLAKLQAPPAAATSPRRSASA